MEFASALQAKIAEEQQMEAELDGLIREVEMGVEDHFSESGILPVGLKRIEAKLR